MINLVVSSTKKVTLTPKTQRAPVVAKPKPTPITPVKATNPQVDAWKKATTAPQSPYTSAKTVGGEYQYGGATNANVGTSTKPYGLGNPAPGYSDDDYRTPVTGVYVPGLAPTNPSYASNEALKGTKSDYTQGGLGNTGQNPTSPVTQPPSDMSQFEKMFGDWSTANDGRLTALEKMIKDLIAGNAYKGNQGAGQINTSQGVYDGSHIYTAPNKGSAVGSTQSNNGVNDTLFKYLQNIWNGGF